MKWLGVAAGLLLASGLALATPPTTVPHVAPTQSQAPQPEGEPLSGGETRDPDFGVTTRQFGLERRVEMYQWSTGEHGYRRVWNPALIDSSRFAPGYENPPEFPLPGERWWAPGPTLDGRPLHGSVLRQFGEWREFRPGFSRLPANLAATFQPDGDGLVSAENPLDPQIGDLRVNWRELVLPSLQGRVALRDGVWHPLPGTGQPSPIGPVPMLAEIAPIEIPGRQWWPWLVALLLSLLVVVALSRRNKR